MGMGCGSAREKLENEMILMKLERIGIQMERQNQVKLLENIDGRKIKVPNIPDYLESRLQIKDISNKRKKINRRMFTSKKNLPSQKRSKSMFIRNKIRNQETNVITDKKRRKKPKKNTSIF